MLAFGKKIQMLLTKFALKWKATLNISAILSEWYFLGGSHFIPLEVTASLPLEKTTLRTNSGRKVHPILPSTSERRGGEPWGMSDSMIQ